MVEDVGSVHPELDCFRFAHFEAFAEAAVKSPGAGKLDDVLAEVAAGSGLWILQHHGSGRIRDRSERAHGPKTDCDDGALRIGDFLVTVTEIVAVECAVLPLDLPFVWIEGTHPIPARRSHIVWWRPLCWRWRRSKAE